MISSPVAQPRFGSILLRGADYDPMEGKGHLMLQFTDGNGDFRRFNHLAAGCDTVDITVAPTNTARQGQRGLAIGVFGYDTTAEPGSGQHFIPVTWQPNQLAELVKELITRAKEPSRQFDEEKKERRELSPFNYNDGDTVSESPEYPDYLATQALLRQALHTPLSRMGLGVSA
jgi:hypothetical protein